MNKTQNNNALPEEIRRLNGTFILIMTVVIIIFLAIFISGLVYMKRSDEIGNDPTRMEEKRDLHLTGLILLTGGFFFLAFFGFTAVGVYLDKRNSIRKVYMFEEKLYNQKTNKELPTPCPDCNFGMIYSEEYKKYYCEECNKYFNKASI